MIEWWWWNGEMRERIEREVMDTYELVLHGTGEERAQRGGKFRYKYGSIRFESLWYSDILISNYSHIWLTGMLTPCTACHLVDYVSYTDTPPQADDMLAARGDWPHRLRRNWNGPLLNGFVRTSAIIFSVGQWRRQTVLILTSSRIKWYWTFICLVLAWKVDWDVSWIAPRLSQWSVVGFVLS